jgi:hypothetical protein
MFELKKLLVFQNIFLFPNNHGIDLRCHSHNFALERIEILVTWTDF